MADHRSANRFASEAFEVGNANMEYDAALDAMTIDASHENELGMEGVDMSANKFAALSGKLDTMDTSNGIDFDGDGVVDVAAGKPGQLMKYSEFKPPGIHVATEIAMSSDPQCPLKDYAPEANGIIPGYAGHIPRARDKYGGTAHNGCSVAKHGHKHIGPQIAHEKNEALGNKYGTDGLPLRGKDIEPTYDNYKAKVAGVMPGYGGFRPGARDECGYAQVGGIKRFGVAETRTAHNNPKPGYVHQAKGVLPGYTGYVPSAKNTHGISHYGSLDGGHHSAVGVGAQLGHANVKGDRNLEVSKQIKSGYSGHVPRSRDTFGGAHYGVGSHLSPDGYIAENEADGVTRNNQDMRLVTGSDAGNSEYANDGGGGFFGAKNHLAEYHNYATDDEPPPSQVAGRNSQAIAGMQGIQSSAGKFGADALAAWWDAAALDQLQNATLVAEALRWRDIRSAQYSLLQAQDGEVSQVAEPVFQDLFDLACSRALGARGEDGGAILRIVPMIDMAQHCPKAGGQFVLRDGAICLLAGRACEEGDECFLDYGARTSDEFALQYGFVPGRNVHDAVTVPLLDSSSSARRSVHVGWRCERNGASAEVREACAAMLSSFPTSLAEDIAALRQLERDAAPAEEEEACSSEQLAIALSYRIGKKQLLTAVAGVPVASAATSAFATMEMA